MSFRTKRLIVGAFILIAGLGIAALLGKLKPPLESEDQRSIEILVDVLPLESSTVNFEISSQGTVRPRTETILSAEVAGSIVSISPEFIAGGVFAAGEELMRIDPTNYEGEVEQAEAVLKQRQIEFDGAQTLRTQGYRAEAEFAAAGAAMATAKSDLIRARRDLERTRIRLPYEGMVRSKQADLGQYVNPGTALGIVFSTDSAEVRLPLTDQDLAFVDLPDITTSAGTVGPLVTLTAVQRGVPVTWQAQIVRTEGVVDERARVTYAVAKVADPYKLHDDSRTETPLPMGTFVRATIGGKTADNVVRVPRTALRGNGQLVFVDKGGRIRIRDVEILRADSEYAYIRSETISGERISLTVIESPINGMKVSVVGEAREEDSENPRLAVGDDK
jgi:RND family efflux transporter MFP subunit